MLEIIIVASNLPKQNKLPALRDASIKIDLLRVYLRLGKDLKIIENKKYLEFESAVTEIGKMVGGWIKATSQF